MLDTHALLWWTHEVVNLSPVARAAIADGENEVMVSAVSAMEIALKNRKGTLGYKTPFADRFVPEAEAESFALLSVSSEHAQRAGGYPWAHKDPWDRLLAAQAEIEGLSLVTIDKKFAEYGIPTVW